jgi:oligopeptide/dipeptide ABC transporter ATP-binding protein
LGLVAENADRAAVMYAGRIVEEAPAERLLAAPRHPYTALLLRSRPGLMPLRLPSERAPAPTREGQDARSLHVNDATSRGSGGSASPHSGGVESSTHFAGSRRRVRLAAIAGSPPSPFERPSGCRFRTRCPLARDVCASVEPELVRVDGGATFGGGALHGDSAAAVPGVHRSACHFTDEVESL